MKCHKSFSRQRNFPNEGKIWEIAAKFNWIFFCLFTVIWWHFNNWTSSPKESRFNFCVCMSDGCVSVCKFMKCSTESDIERLISMILVVTKFWVTFVLESTTDKEKVQQRHPLQLSVVAIEGNFRVTLDCGRQVYFTLRQIKRKYRFVFDGWSVVSFVQICMCSKIPWIVFRKKLVGC